MASQSAAEPYANGTWVRIRNSGFDRAEIVEYRGPLGPKGTRIYRLCVRHKPSPAYIEVREDQMEVLSENES
jgi:hypothetical protein